MFVLPNLLGMNSDARLPRRWVGIALGAALVLGACSSATTDEALAVDEIEEPNELALDVEETATDESSPDVEELEMLGGLTAADLTPELFEELKADPVSRAAVVEEMSNQGLDAEQAECFLDNVSPGLFITFSLGDQPDDAQFGELLQLLETCEIAFGAES